MTSKLAADAVVLLHFGFIVYVVLGGLLALRRPWLAVLHLPCVAWGTWIEFSGGICPLTPWENRLRLAAGEAGYAGGFIDHYLIPVIYPPHLTSAVQATLGVTVVLINLAVYALVLRRSRRERD